MIEDKKSETFKLLLFILKNKKRNSIIFGSIFIISVILVFFVIPKEYTAEVSILPSASTSQGISGKLGNLATLAGVSLGSSSTRSPDMYSGIISSRKLLEKIIFQNYSLEKEGEQRTVNLIEFFELEKDSLEVAVQKALKKLREDIIVVDIDSDNDILYLLVTMEDPDIAAQVANYIIEVLDELVLTEVEKEITEQHSYLKMRLAESTDSLGIAEKELKKLLETTRDPALPEFQIAQLRTRRKLEIQTAIYVELRKQQELMYLENFINLSHIKILDRAFPPYRKSRPKRLFVLITFLALGALMQMGANWAIYLYRNNRFLFSGTQNEYLSGDSVKN